MMPSKDGAGAFPTACLAIRILSQVVSGWEHYMCLSCFQIHKSFQTVIFYSYGSVDLLICKPAANFVLPACRHCRARPARPPMPLVGVHIREKSYGIARWSGTVRTPVRCEARAQRPCNAEFRVFPPAIRHLPSSIPDFFFRGGRESPDRDGP